MKKTMTFLTAVTLAFSAFTSPLTSAAQEQIDYVALGDSLAAGQLYNGTFGEGYAGLIRAEIEAQGSLGSFTKQYAASGQTSGQLLEKLAQADVQQSIQDAELITVSIGANDFIQLIQQGGSITTTEGLALINTVIGNVKTAIHQMKTLNPTADIYIFGYYFPLPYTEEGTEKNKLKTAFSLFNSNLKLTAEANGASFVEISSVFDPYATLYLPNKLDIHPNEAGYELFANQFFGSYNTVPAFPDPNGSWGTVFEKGSVSATRHWTINLSKTVDPASLPESVYVVKDGTVLLNTIQPTVSADGKSITIPSPAGGYTTGNYTVLITNNLKDTSGKPLKTSVKMTFTIQR